MVGYFIDFQLLAVLPHNLAECYRCSQNLPFAKISIVLFKTQDQTRLASYMRLVRPFCFLCCILLGGMAQTLCFHLI